MRVVVLRPPYNTLDHSAIHVDEKGLADSHRQFAAGSHNKVLEYYTGNRHKNPLSSAASLNDVSEVRFYAIFIIIIIIIARKHTIFQLPLKAL